MLVSKAALEHIPLSSAYLCQDCDSIGNCSSFCPACASPALMGLAGVLNRPQAAASIVEFMPMIVHERRMTHIAAPRHREPMRLNPPGQDAIAC